MTEESRVSESDLKISRLSGIINIKDKHPHGNEIGDKSKRRI